MWSTRNTSTHNIGLSITFVCCRFNERNTKIAINFALNTDKPWSSLDKLFHNKTFFGSGLNFRSAFEQSKRDCWMMRIARSVQCSIAVVVLELQKYLVHIQKSFYFGKKSMLCRPQKSWP